MRGGPTIKALEDVPSQEMWRFEFADGHTASIWEKWIEVTPRFSAFWNTWEPGAMGPDHGHNGDHSVLILAGEVRCGDRLLKAGDHVTLEWGDTFGPWEAGPEGCEMYGFIAATEPRSTATGQRSSSCWPSGAPGSCRCHYPRTCRRGRTSATPRAASPAGTPVLSRARAGGLTRLV